MDISGAFMIESKDLERATPESIINEYTKFNCELGPEFVEKFSDKVIDRMNAIPDGLKMEDAIPFDQFMEIAISSMIESSDENKDKDDSESEVEWMYDDFQNLYKLLSKIQDSNTKYYLVDTDLCDTLECEAV